MDDEFDVKEGAALAESSGEESPEDEAQAAANGGLGDDEHVSMKGDLWSDEDESFEDIESGGQKILSQTPFYVISPWRSAIRLSWEQCGQRISMREELWSDEDSEAGSYCLIQGLVFTANCCSLEDLAEGMCGHFFSSTPGAWPHLQILQCSRASPYASS